MTPLQMSPYPCSWDGRNRVCRASKSNQQNGVCAAQYSSFGNDKSLRVALEVWERSIMKTPYTLPTLPAYQSCHRLLYDVAVAEAIANHAAAHFNNRFLRRMANTITLEVFRHVDFWCNGELDEVPAFENMKDAKQRLEFATKAVGRFKYYLFTQFLKILQGVRNGKPLKVLLG